MRLIELYFGGEDFEDENVAPEVVNGANVFSFGVSTQSGQSSFEEFTTKDFQGLSDNNTNSSNNHASFNGFVKAENNPTF